MSNLQIMSSQSVVHRRLPNFEILRVLAMFLIIVGHFFFHGLCGEGNGVMLSYDGKSVLDTVSFGIAQSLWVFSSISVNLYVLISGYFLVQSKAKWSKILRFGYKQHSIPCAFIWYLLPSGRGV